MSCVIKAEALLSLAVTLEVQDRTSSAHVSQIRGRDKFLDPAHPWMPPSIPSWDRAMRAVDRSACANPTTDRWGYWIPEPALLLGPKDPVGAGTHCASSLAWVEFQELEQMGRFDSSRTVMIPSRLDAYFIIIITTLHTLEL